MSPKILLAALMSYFGLLSLPALQPAAVSVAALPAVQESKVAQVNIQEVIASTREGKKTFAALQKRFAPRQAELKKQQDEVANLKEQLATKTAQLTDKERDKRNDVIKNKEQAVRANYEQTNREFTQAEQEIVNRLGREVLTVLAKYSKAKGYAVVLEVSSPQVGILWASEETVRSLGLSGKPQPEIEKGLLAAFAAKRGATITKELVDACDAEIK